jgi:glycosyltransferase involved in cell wall biosynthesis
MTNQPRKADHPIDSISKVYVNPQSKIKYISYYLGGLNKIIGERNVRFSSAPFRDLEVPNPWTAYEHYAAMLFVTKNNRKIRVVIDFHDSRIHIPEAYRWCDVYAKVNLERNTLPAEEFPKVISIAPSSFTRIWSDFTTKWHMWTNMVRCGFKLHSGGKRFQRDYEFMSSSMSIEDFESARSLSDMNDDGSNPYIFLVASLWHHPFCLENTNPWRKKFMEACRSLPCTFEGGFFAYDQQHPALKEYEDFLVKTKYSPQEYFENMAKSIVTFSTPSVHECHGIKLAEYLAMGKSIIATPITNLLPGPGLEHGKNIHIVSTEQELREGLVRMIQDRDYRERIAEGARAYYDEYISPTAAVTNLVGNDVFRARM